MTADEAYERDQADERHALALDAVYEGMSAAEIGGE